MMEYRRLAWFPKPFGPGDMDGSGEQKVLGRPEVDFLNLVRAQLTLYNYETQYWKMLAAAHQALANLAAAVGKETINE